MGALVLLTNATACFVCVFGIIELLVLGFRALRRIVLLP
jgi:hypothetical protein